VSPKNRRTESQEPEYSTAPPHSAAWRCTRLDQLGVFTLEPDSGIRQSGSDRKNFFAKKKNESRGDRYFGFLCSL